MKLLRRLTAVLLLVGLVVSCKKEQSVETGGNPSGKPQWEFDESAILYKGVTDSAEVVEQIGIQVIELHGATADGLGGFFLTLTGNNIAPGTYHSPEASFQYTVGGTAFFETDPSQPNQFSVTVTRLDAVGIEGTFSGVVIDAAAGGVKNIENGKFAAKFKSIPLPGATGQLLLWAKQGCGAGADLLVKVKDQTGHITDFSTTQPACGASGSANFTLPAGDYTWRAYCGSDSAEGVVTVNAGDCAKAEVVFASSAGTTCRVSNLASYDLPTGAALGAITSFFNATNQVSKVQLYDSTAGAVQNAFNVSYNGAQVNVDATQYFLLEPGARIHEFHGYIDPTDNTSPRAIITYEYDASGFMTKALVAPGASPANVVIEETFTWVNENLTKAVLLSVGTGERTEIEYEYDLTKQPRGFLCLLPNSEILTFQTAINPGRNSTNLVTRSTITEYNASNAVTSTTVSEFTDYTIDANNYVKSFSITGDGSVYGSSVRYVLSYKCL